jgi:hypothetical protein
LPRSPRRRWPCSAITSTCTRYKRPLVGLFCLYSRPLLRL